MSVIGIRNGIFSSEFGEAISAAVAILGFVALIWALSASLLRSEREIARQKDLLKLILDRLWRSVDISSTETVRTHIKNLRQKLGDIDGSLIVTRRGLGYSLHAGASPHSSAPANAS